MNSVHTIDAEGKSLGRVASEAATLLMGKNTAAFERHVPSKSTVTILNASKLKVSEKQLAEKVYDRFSGYPSGRKEETMAQLLARKGYHAILEHAIRGMLPGNRLRTGTLKRLSIKE